MKISFLKCFKNLNSHARLSDYSSFFCFQQFAFLTYVSRLTAALIFIIVPFTAFSHLNCFCYSTAPPSNILFFTPQISRFLWLNAWLLQSLTVNDYTLFLSASNQINHVPVKSSAILRYFNYF